jgi:hypothetical protein
MTKARFIIAVLLLSTNPSAVHTQNRNPSIEKFKQEMKPQVGKKITVVGKMNSAKLGWMVAFKQWGIYLYSVNSDTSKMEDLNRFFGHTVRVTATLRYFPEPPKSDRIEAVPPEHFYFDVAEAIVTDLSSPRRRRSRRSRPKG